MKHIKKDAFQINEERTGHTYGGRQVARGLHLPRTLTAYITNSVACFPAEPRYGFGIFPHVACQPASSIYQCTQHYLTSNAETISYLFEKIKLYLYCTPYAKINST